MQKDQPILRDILDKAIETITDAQREEIINRHTGLVLHNGLDYKIVMIASFIVLSIIIVIILWNKMLQAKVKHEVDKSLQISQQLHEKSKKAELSNMIANISHQWREPLSRLSSINLITIAKLKTAQPIERAYLEQQTKEIEDTISFMSQTMQDFLEFYKNSDRVSSFIAIESIHIILSIAETKLKDNNITINIYENYHLILQGIKNEWMQVWLNIINNSINAFLAREI